MGTMKTFDSAATFTPTELEAPDGRPFTAGSLAEYNELVAKGYKVVKGETPAPQTDDATTLAAADTAPATADAQTLVDPPATAETPADTATPAAKAAGRNGGAK